MSPSAVSALTPADVELHARLGVPFALLERAGVRRVSDVEAREQLSSRHPGDLSGILYPYLDPETNTVVTCRVRRDHPEMENGRPRDKYLSAYGDNRHLYFAPSALPSLSDTAATVVLVEAEKSVLAIAAAGDRASRQLLPIGTGGCWGWRGRRGKGLDETGTRVDEVGPLTDLNRITWTGRQAIILFDANAATNPKVQAARQALAGELRRRGARVHLASLPADDPTINGPDDLIAERGDVALWSVVDDAPIAGVGRFRGTNPVGDDATSTGGTPPLTLTSMGELLAEADEAVDYLVEGLIQTGSVNVLSAKPKVGKSTLARHLSVAVAQQDDFLGRRCPQRGTVWYLAFEGRRSDIKTSFRKLGASADDPIFLFTGQAPKDVVDQVRARAVQERPDLVVIDTMQRFLQAESTDDYAEMTNLLNEVIGITQQSGAAILLLTHSSKAERSGLDAILGSTAIAGTAETIILMTRSARYRTIATVQRTGVDLDETVLVMDDATGRVRLGGTREAADKDLVARQLVEALEAAGDPLTQKDWFDRVEARRQVKLAALRNLMSEPAGEPGNQNVIRTGAGTKNSPHLYELGNRDSSSGFPLRGGNQKPPTLPFTAIPDDSSINCGSQILTQQSGTAATPGSAEPVTEDPDATTF